MSENTKGIMNKIYQKINKFVREPFIECQRFYQKKYPDFLTDRDPDPLNGQVPVFMFHTVNALTLKHQLEFLKNNDYQTLDLKNFMSFLKGETELKKQSVLLTFDDGERSWYEIAYPLLRQYGFHAVGFVVPSYIKDQTETVKNNKGWLTWSELIEMEESKIFEFESHSFYHAQVFIEPKLVDFFHPKYSHSWSLDTPWINDNNSYTNQLKWGTPIYRSAPRLAGFSKYIDDEVVRHACVNWVKSQGSREFFNHNSWRKELNRIYQVFSKKEKTSLGKYETITERQQAILEDLEKAKKVLSEKLNKPICHLCYPWGAGCELSVSLSKQAGYSSNFWVSLDRRNTNKVGDNPYYIPRIKDDYIFRLPGKGRKYLWQIFKDKLIRRLTKVDIY